MYPSENMQIPITLTHVIFRLNVLMYGCTYGGGRDDDGWMVIEGDDGWLAVMGNVRVGGW